MANVKFSPIEKISFWLLVTGFILGFAGIFIYQIVCDSLAFFTALMMNLLQLIYIGILAVNNKINLKSKKITIMNLLSSIVLFLYGLVVFIVYFNAVQVSGVDCGYGLMGVSYLGIVPFLVFCFSLILNAINWMKRNKNSILLTKQIVIGSIVCLLFNTPSFIFTLMDNSFDTKSSEGFLEYVLYFFFNKMSLGIYNISFIVLLVSGVAMMIGKKWSLKLSISALRILIGSGLIYILYFIVSVSTIKTRWDIPFLKKVSMVMAGLLFQPNLWGPIIYAFFLKRSLKRVEINNKEQDVPISKIT